MELEELDQRTIKLLTMYGAQQPKADVDRLYLQRCEGGRGMKMIPILEKLEKGIQSMFDWFPENFLKANDDKSNLIASSKVPVDIQISHIKVTSESRVKLLGIHIDNRLNFDYDVSQLCKKASKKLHALARILKYVETSKRRVLVNSFITSQFSYCPLI